MGTALVVGEMGMPLVVARVVLFGVVVAALAVVLEAAASENLVHHLAEPAPVKGKKVVVSEVWVHPVHQIWRFLWVVQEVASLRALIRSQAPRETHLRLLPGVVGAEVALVAMAVAEMEVVAMAQVVA